MPHLSERQELLDTLHFVALHVMQARQQNLSLDMQSDVESDVSEDPDDNDNPLEAIIIPPPSPLPPLVLLDPLDSEDESDDWNSAGSMDEQDRPYQRLLGEIVALIDEVEQARCLNRLNVPLLRAPQLHLLEHFAVFRPHLFRRKLRVDPAIFDCIIDKICNHPIFNSRGNRLQLPVSIQLAIFLNRAGHYGNAISPEDVAQWAGVSVGSVVNCTHRVMVALLSHHNEFISLPDVDSQSMEQSRSFVEERSCPGWRNGIFAADGSAIPLFQKPGYFGETFYDRKSNYSLNCQLVIMPHDLRIVDYGLGHPGSVHDAHAFLGTRIARNPGLIPPGHWIWADSAYPMNPWCAVPFKAMRGGGLSRSKNIFNKHLSKVRVRVEHAFAALKGRFQSLRELRLVMRTRENVRVAVHWIQCCMILHNMIIQFEDELGVEKSVGWARQEGVEPYHPVAPVVVEVNEGTPGQAFRTELMRRLAEHLNHYRRR